MYPQPTLVLVPGSFATTDMYEPLVAPLRAKGHTIHVLEPPCYPASYKTSSGKPPPSMYDDAKFINTFVVELIEEGKEVVVLAHSYGGIPASESLKGVTKKEREQLGKKGGVVRIAYLAAIVPRIGQSLGGFTDGNDTLPVEVGEDGWMFQPDSAATARVCFNNLSPETGAAAAAKFGKHYSACFGDKLTHNGYKDIPVSWLLCEEDLCVIPEMQQTSIVAIEESWVGTEREGRKVDITRASCDHIPIVDEGKRKEVSQWVEKILKMGGQE
ncbi:alpha/beta-hydrolase [Clathrospora elynae]|uniref:Alpha/beta-hydrolase n=1 Tax=Clathrospora elynae TaxID=706981 RepID=A0A6A5SWG2_9PLEO|nr:alpha/beta-hydrolase [Clathrospora elynae]